MGRSPGQSISRISHLDGVLADVRNRKIPGRSISRILSNRRVSKWTTPVWMIISLGRMSPPGSCSLPGTRGKRAASRLRTGFVPAWPCSRWGLPGRRITATPVVPYTTFSTLPRRAVCFCGPIQRFPVPGVTRHLALWSADFPQYCLAVLRSPDRPGRVNHTAWAGFRQFFSPNCPPKHRLPRVMVKIVTGNVTRFTSQASFFRVRLTCSIHLAGKVRVNKRASARP